MSTPPPPSRNERLAFWKDVIPLLKDVVTHIVELICRAACAAVGLYVVVYVAHAAVNKATGWDRLTLALLDGMLAHTGYRVFEYFLPTSSKGRKQNKTQGADGKPPKPPKLPKPPKPKGGTKGKKGEASEPEKQKEPGTTAGTEQPDQE